MVVTVFVGKYPCDLKLLTAPDAHNEIISPSPPRSSGRNSFVCMGSACLLRLAKATDTNGIC